MTDEEMARINGDLLAVIRWTAGRIDDALAFMGDGRAHDPAYALSVLAEIRDEVVQAARLAEEGGQP